MRAIVVLVMLAGCIEDDLVECADDRVCPEGTACDIAHHSCVDPEQLAACEGAEQFAPCTAVDNGRCFDGVCLTGGCANGFVEPEEQCDDANVQNGDGCASDCLSREICGDGVVDPRLAEQCDDGNERGRDGCSAACTTEDRVWRLFGGTPLPRQRPNVVFDPARRQLVLFGGADETLLTFGDTWEWNGRLWAETTPALSPPSRFGAAFAYDPRRHRVVMFGGLATNEFLGLLGDTWEWDGVQWTRLRPTRAPRARTGQSMVWDGSGIVMFGGLTGQGTLRDTWRWDGTEWTELELLVAPPPRSGASSMHDAKHERIVLIGGFDPDSLPLADVWTFDGERWEELATTGDVPPLLDWMSAAYDPVREVVVLAGITSGTHRTFELSGTVWIERAPANPPPPTLHFTLAYDFNRGTVLQLMGTVLDETSVLGSVHEWNGTDWQAVVPDPLPQARHAAGISADPVRGRVVVFGGARSNLLSPATLLADTWEWDGRGWTEHVVVGPSKRRHPAMTYDASTGHAVLFGGIDQTPTRFADTWTWNGATWTALAVTGPSARHGAAFAYDPVRRRAVLFGGEVADGVFSAETWEWNGTVWADVTTPGPSPRRGASMTFDPVRSRLVLFGGTDQAVLDDTWEWDGTSWTAVDLAVRPEARTGHALVFDRARSQLALFGGDLLDFSPWEFDGTTWTHETPVTQPGSRSDAAAVYDSTRSEIVMFGGAILFGSFRETWVGSYRGTPEEVCRFGGDLDGDGEVACEDEDCAFVCQPACFAGPCNDGPHCGDGVCSAIESDRLCPIDCTPSILCGDGFCSPGETCAADC